VSARVLLLSPWDREMVQGWFGDRAEVVDAPPPPAPAELKRLAAGADVVIGDQRHKHRLDMETLSVMQRCRLIQMPAVGFDVVDHRAAAELGIPVANCAGYNRDAVADWVLMAILNLLRFGAYGDRRMRTGEWPFPGMRGRELGALTVGIVGLGNVGTAVASRVTAFGSRVLFCDVVPKGFLGARQVAFEELLRESDVVTVHTPLDRDTRGLIDEEALGVMKPDALLVNASRGPVVDERALVAALQAGRIAGAALDVYEVEPLPADSPLRSLDNVFLAPHVGGATVQAQSRVLEVVRANVERALAGEELINVVNATVRRA
jgi:D-3-phosphoglycerate dehydrogenase / 2-oxoglutarate reductase